MSQPHSRVYIDADIIIEHLRDHSPATELIRRLAESDTVILAIAALQRVEVVFHLRPGEVERASSLLALFVTAPLTDDVIDLGAQFYRRWAGSHGVGEADALLAATAVLTNGMIVTQNTRHFPEPEVTAERGW